VIEFAEIPNDRMAHILGHLHRHASVVQTHNVQAAWQVEFQQSVYASANVEQVLQLRLLVNELLGRRPHHGMVGQLGGLAGRGGLPLPNVNAGQGLPKTLEPRICFGIGATKYDFHSR